MSKIKVEIDLDLDQASRCFYDLSDKDQHSIVGSWIQFMVPCDVGEFLLRFLDHEDQLPELIEYLEKRLRKEAE